MCHVLRCFFPREAAMKTLTIREAREGLSHPDQMFADSDEVLVVKHGEPVARILPVEPKRRVRSLRAFLESQPMQTVPSEDILAEEREDRI
ncbi:prevent-host-death protein [Thiobacillus denitrificans ATCC 25259]|uniref:Prevent-host-death protein n=2 Tax=Thiobacillus denitrificans TaxID=36861 RepID=Q3SKD7_THIDA|nr:prevent-host-death protein [Thiobacillus denitrificans ATCC 25259]